MTTVQLAQRLLIEEEASKQALLRAILSLSERRDVQAAQEYLEASAIYEEERRRP